MSPMNIRYDFDSGDQHREYAIQVDRKSLECIKPDDSSVADWAALNFHQCPNCPLDVKAVPHCPVAENLAPLISLIGDLNSYDNVRVSVTFDDREMTIESTMQRAVSSLLGLIMATSPCPFTTLFRPMARFHQPLSNDLETIFRASATYLIAQYFRVKDGFEFDAELEGLKKIYQNIQVVNKALASRLRAACEQDAAVNAVILLDLLAKEIPYSIDDALDDIRFMFEPYLEQPNTPSK